MANTQPSLAVHSTPKSARLNDDSAILHTQADRPSNTQSKARQSKIDGRKAKSERNVLHPREAAAPIQFRATRPTRSSGIPCYRIRAEDIAINFRHLPPCFALHPLKITELNQSSMIGRGCPPRADCAQVLGTSAQLKLAERTIGELATANRVPDDVSCQQLPSFRLPAEFLKKSLQMEGPLGVASNHEGSVTDLNKKLLKCSSHIRVGDGKSMLAALSIRPWQKLSRPLQVQKGQNLDGSVLGSKYAASVI
mmetsp:Transcript_40664/g.97489  ORF Transcript_40664/g.97489 Transcript_40664/m.97489 type:complete len:252 (-) Transcript_40664:406-1161(-)